MYCASRARVAHRGVAPIEHVRDGIDLAPVGVVAHAVLVDGVAEAVERLREADHARRVEPEELLHERGDAPDLRGLVVLDDVAGLPFFLQEVVDERLGLEGQEVVDRRRHEEDGLRWPARVRTNASMPVPASPSFKRRSTPPLRERVPPGKKSEW